MNEMGDSLFTLGTNAGSESESNLRKNACLSSFAKFAAVVWLCNPAPSAADGVNFDTVIRDLEERCAAVGGQLVQKDMPVQDMDLGFGPVAFFDTASVDCTAASGLFSHTGGHDFYAVDVEGIAVWSVRQWQVAPAFGGQVLLLLRHGSYCDLSGHLSCIEAVSMEDGRFISALPIQRM